MGRFSKMFIVIKRYLVNSNLHGIRYLVEDGLHWTERLFWLITCASCWLSCIIMVKNSLDGFYNRPVAFTTETTHLDWEVKFPSIAICLRPHPESFYTAGSLFEKKYGTPIKIPKIWSWLFANSFMGENTMKISALSVITSADVIELYKKSVLNCTSLMGKCVWLSVVKFNCCDEFVPMQTAAGLCYMFNSIHTKIDKSLTKFTMNKDTGTGYLSIGFTDLNYYSIQPAVAVYIDNNMAIPSPKSNSKEIGLSKDKVNHVYFNLEETFNEPGLRQVSPAKRRCRFPDETENFHAYRWYSNVGCEIELQMENMMKFCDCVSHLFPYQMIGMPVCNFTRLACLKKYEDKIMTETNSGIRCLPDCEGTIIRYYQNSKAVELFNYSKYEISQGIHFELLTLPTSRYRRYVVRSLLDLVVAVGSTAGLFMGAGILSLVEIPFWLLWRHE